MEGGRAEGSFVVVGPVAELAHCWWPCVGNTGRRSRVARADIAVFVDLGAVCTGEVRRRDSGRGRSVPPFADIGWVVLRCICDVACCVRGRLYWRW